ncbi:Hypothetical predicted protein [Paramuricea clavata]|uniref:Uncharacterized protein n=1 Tax=Paramuricea clavata TaxID=317549 RepID=A0A6S7GLW8_PARCT|nr:Hypothetical predicted protein [Paramuricea clavata]
MFYDEIKASKKGTRQGGILVNLSQMGNQSPQKSRLTFDDTTTGKLVVTSGRSFDNSIYIAMARAGFVCGPVDE